MMNFYNLHFGTSHSHGRHLNTKSRSPIDIVVALPAEEGNIGRNPYKLTIGRAKPVFDVAIEDLYHQQLLPRGTLRIAYVDTELSDSIGPQKVVDRYCNKSVDAVMGLAYVFALAPVHSFGLYNEEIYRF